MPFLSDHTTITRKQLRWLRVILLGYILFIFSATSSHAQSNEYQVKAVFIFNFTHFVKWPARIFRDPRAPFVIGILGKNAGPYLEETIEGETVDNHPIRVQYFDNAKGVGNCHILFIERSHASSIRKVVEELGNNPTLTVSDADNFMRESGMIQLYNDNDKIRLEINQKKSEESSLEISSKLLSLATIYKSK